MRHFALVMPVLLLFCGPLRAQFEKEIPSGGGGDAYSPEPTHCLTDEQHVAIATMLAENEQKLRNQGLIGPEDASSAVSFGWPLQLAPGFNWNNFALISNFVDHAQDQTLLDYNCGNRTYDGHQGTDIALWPFPWYLKNNNLAQVVAAESGIILLKQDGNSDENCTWGNQQWNAIYVRHADGSVAWYGHMKKNSLTSKNLGDSVAQGEYLGIVASSGISTGPHLHFEVYRQQPYQPSNRIDPYAGTCNGTSSGVSWWANQDPYRKPTLNAALTHNAVPEHGCPSGNENPHFSTQFAPGAGLLYTAIYFRDQQQGQITTLRLRMPNGSLWKNWTHTSPDTYSGSWWWWSWALPTNGPFGTWAFEATSEGQTMVQPFTYGNMVSTESEVLAHSLTLVPNPTSGSFRVSSAEDGELQVQIFDQVGRLRSARQAQTNNDLPTEGLERGIYFVRVVQGGQAVLLRLVRE
ncbi:MAG: peptidoglycan DD-metalloendopeptidase family protein [Saprospiraceae bacterium]